MSNFVEVTPNMICDIVNSLIGTITPSYIEQDDKQVMRNIQVYGEVLEKLAKQLVSSEVAASCMYRNSAKECASELMNQEQRILKALGHSFF